MKVARPLPPVCRFTKTPLLSGVGTRRPFAQARGVRSTLASMPAGHVSRVRALYRGILLLHRGLPPDLKALGDQYVKDEFRRHKTVGSDEAQRFLQEWEVYAAVLWQQTNENRQNSTERVCFGVALPEEKLNDFRDEQIGQLQELMQEATKPNRQFSIPESRKPEF